MDLNLSYPIAETVISSPAAVPALRTSLKQKIWGISGALPTANPSPGETTRATTYFGQTPASTTWLVNYYAYGGVYNPIYGANSGGIVMRSHLSKFTGSTCLLIVNGGHGEGFFPSSPTPFFTNKPEPETQAMVRRFVAAGCDVLMSSMPMTGENEFSNEYLGYPVGPQVVNYPNFDAHLLLGTSSIHAPPAGKGTPLQYFLGAPMASLNYALSLRSYDKVISTGISGGGWTTTMLAALEPRITHSYAVAGSVPFAHRGEQGDWEQYGGMAALDYIDYSDLYLMGMIDDAGLPTRKARLLYNGKDECCFKSASVGAWAGGLKHRAKAEGFGDLRIVIDPDKVRHAIHSTHVSFMLSDLAQP